MSMLSPLHTYRFEEKRIMEEVVLDEADMLSRLFSRPLYHDIPRPLSQQSKSKAAQSSRSM